MRQEERLDQTRPAASVRPRRFLVALVGNPNAGKTTLFNALTGLRQKVGNYPGVTVELKEGKLLHHTDRDIVLLDLPGTYSLDPHSPDEQIATDFLTGREKNPDLVVCVVDATHLERNLFLATQIIEQRRPLIIALTLSDAAEAEGTRIDSEMLTRELDVPVIPVVATQHRGIEDLSERILHPPLPSRRVMCWQLPAAVEREVSALAQRITHARSLPIDQATSSAAELLAASSDDAIDVQLNSPELIEAIRKARAKIEFLGGDRHSIFIEARYAWIRQLCHRVVSRSARAGVSFTDRVDRFATHRVWGPLIFIVFMALMFQSIFSWAAFPMKAIGSGFDLLASGIASVLPPGDLRDLLIQGALAGVAGVVTFLPQIVFLFLFLGLLEDSGYMARAAFLMERVMRRVGLNGRSFIPLLGSFACAIPGIMATRTIDNPKDRLATMLVAPLMSCSARLPVYTLLIAAFVPPTLIFGVLSLPALTLLSLYLLGTFAALLMAALFKKTFLRGAPPPFIIELPPYRLPSIKTVFYQVWEKALSFLKTAGTIILGASILLWFLATYPKLEHGSRADKLEHSYAGRIGKQLEPLIAPLGFDWKIGIGLVSSVMQREAFVSTMATIYNLQTEDGQSVSLQEALRQDVDPVTGVHQFTLLTALCLMVYYVLAMQCLSTVAVMRRETRSWRWPLFQVAYMTLLAYGGTYVVYRIGISIGLGG